MRASTLMTRQVATCVPSDSLQRAAQLMWDRDCGALPVVDAEGRVVGMISDRDVCMAAYMEGRQLADLHVSSAMSKRVHAVRADDRVEKVHELMRAHRVHRLPVVDAGGRVAGILSINDLVRHAHVTIGGPCDEVAGNRVLLTLAAIVHGAPPDVQVAPAAVAELPPIAEGRGGVGAPARPA